MVIQNYRDIKNRASKALDYTPWDLKKLVLVYGGVPLGMGLLLYLLDWLVSVGSASVSGLAGLQIYGILATASSVLVTAFDVFRFFWGISIIYCGLMVLREQNPWPQGLLQGFHKWFTLLKLMILAAFSFMAIMLLIAPLASMIALPFMGDFLELYAQIPTTSQEEMIAFLETVPSQELMQAMMPAVILLYVALAAVAIPLFYRARYTVVLILDEEQIGARQALRTSFAMTKGSCLQMLRLDLSFWWYYLLGAVCLLIPYGVELPIFSSWNDSLAAVLCYVVYAAATLGIYLLGLMKVSTVHAVAYDHLRTMPQPDLPQLPEESANG